MSCRTVPRGLDMALALLPSGLRVLGCTPSARGDGDQGAMPGSRLDVPHLSLREPLRLPLFVRDCNGPAMASEAGEPAGLPRPWVRDALGCGGGSSRLARMAAPAMLTKVMEAMGVTRAVRGLFGSCIGE
jgi:hypothetical protein